MRTLKDKAIVITGAGGSIAGAVEEVLAAEGARPILIDKDVIRIQARAESYGTLAIEEDLMTAESAERAAQAAHGRMGRIDGLVHLVGDIVVGPFSEVTLEDYERVFSTNVRTLFHAVRAFLPYLRQAEESALVTIGAQQAWTGGAPGAALFAAAKAAAAAMMRSLDAELDGSPVDVSIITPLGPVDTGTGRSLEPEDAPRGYIAPHAVAVALRSAILAGDGGRLLEVPVHPPR